MWKHKNIEAVYECCRCKKTFNIPTSSDHNPHCPKCEWLYVVWKNYNEYVAQWSWSDDVKPEDLSTEAIKNAIKLGKIQLSKLF